MRPRRYSVFSVQYSAFSLGVLAVVVVLSGRAAELRVDLNPPDRRGDALTPHWENWACKEGSAITNTFGGITVTFRAAPGMILKPVLYKGALDYGAHMAADGIISTEGFEMVIGGLAPGKHSVVTYHNEVRDVRPAALKILVGDRIKVERLLPSKRATNDYEVASAFFEVDATDGKCQPDYQWVRDGYG